MLTGPSARCWLLLNNNSDQPVEFLIPSYAYTFLLFYLFFHYNIIRIITLGFCLGFLLTFCCCCICLVLARFWCIILTFFAFVEFLWDCLTKNIDSHIKWDWDICNNIIFVNRGAIWNHVSLVLTLVILF